MQYHLYLSVRGYARLKKIARARVMHHLLAFRLKGIFDDRDWCVWVDSVSEDNLAARLVELIDMGCSSVRVMRVAPFPEEVRR
jgi:hypothetical protein